MQMNEKVKCFNCNTTLEFEGGSKIHRSEECPKCFSDLYCCKMCTHYDTKSYNECRETQAERITEKDKNNFCDFFVLRGSSNNSNGEQEDLLAKANSLFKF